MPPARPPPPRAAWAGRGQFGVSVGVPLRDGSANGGERLARGSAAGTIVLAFQGNQAAQGDGIAHGVRVGALRRHCEPVPADRKPEGAGHCARAKRKGASMSARSGVRPHVTRFEREFHLLAAARAGRDAAKLRAEKVLAQWPEITAQFVKVMPTDYKRVLGERAKHDEEIEAGVHGVPSHG